MAEMATMDVRALQGGGGTPSGRDAPVNGGLERHPGKGWGIHQFGIT